MAGAGIIMTAADDDLVVSAAEVATTDIVVLAVTVAGALYVAEVVVTPVNVPQAAPVQPVPEADQVTPLLAESLDNVAVYATVCPWSIEVWEEGERETAIWGLPVVLVPPPPQPDKSNNAGRSISKRLISNLPPGPS
jgi:hypothetical protein